MSVTLAFTNSLDWTQISKRHSLQLHITSWENFKYQCRILH